THEHQRGLFQIGGRVRRRWRRIGGGSALSHGRVREIDLAQRIILRGLGCGRIRCSWPARHAGSRRPVDVFRRQLASQRGICGTHIRTQHWRCRLGGIVVFLSRRNFAAQAGFAAWILSRQRKLFLRVGEDTEKEQQQCYANAHEQEERLALVTPEFLPALRRFLLSSRSVEGRPESFAPVSFASLLRRRLFVGYFRLQGCWSWVEFLVFFFSEHGWLPPAVC